MNDKRHEPFEGRFYGIFNVESDCPTPLFLFSDKADAERELARRQALDVEDDDVLTEYHQIFRADVMGVWWNSYDPDPRADSALSRAEILEAHGKAFFALKTQKAKESAGARAAEPRPTAKPEGDLCASALAQQEDGKEDSLADCCERAKRAFDRLSPEAQAKHMLDQKINFVFGNLKLSGSALTMEEVAAIVKARSENESH